jgi:hypothetical protein
VVKRLSGFTFVDVIAELVILRGCVLSEIDCWRQQRIAFERYVNSFVGFLLLSFLFPKLRCMGRMS